MKTLNLKIDLSGLDLSDVDKKKSAERISSEVIQNIIIAYISQSKAPSEDERRKFYKICDSFDAVKEDGNVELEDDWMGLIRKSFKEVVGLVPTKLLRRVEEKVNEVRDR